MRTKTPNIKLLKITITVIYTYTYIYILNYQRYHHHILMYYCLPLFHPTSTNYQHHNHNQRCHTHTKTFQSPFDLSKNHYCLTLALSTKTTIIKQLCPPNNQHHLNSTAYSIPTTATSLHLPWIGYTTKSPQLIANLNKTLIASLNSLLCIRIIKYNYTNHQIKKMICITKCDL